MSTPQKYYQVSGRVWPPGLALALLLALPLCAALGVGYGFLGVQLPGMR